MLDVNHNHESNHEKMCKGDSHLDG